jgi:hypothetical protein
MRFVSGLLLLALISVSSALVGGGAFAFTPPLAPSPDRSPVQDAKIVCGDFGSGYTCKRESGAIRRGKNIKVPGSGSDSSGTSSGGGWFGGSSDDPDALPPASSATGAAPSTTATNCPANTELLGGHCIPYTQRCTASIPPSAAPPLCQGEEKQVCNFHPDGSKDCCCRVYSKF